jgi:hypothetical protein
MAFTMAATYAASSPTANDAHASSDVTAATEDSGRSAGAAERYGYAEEF